MLQPLNTSYQQALEFLYGRINYEQAAAPRRALHLDRMRRLMTALGDPQLKVPLVHVAGTKGKGSVAAMLAASLHASGYRTGLYTSPHLEQLEERYCLDGQPSSADELVGLVDQLRAVVAEFDQQGDPPTFFEITTAMAFLHFQQKRAEIAVLEVGMGGRLDSTNVCQPELAVITSISFDHTKQLGNTLELIAREKAGIIKPGVPTVSGVNAAEPRQAIAEVARQQKSRLIQVDEHFTFEHSVSPGAGSAVSYRAPGSGVFEELSAMRLGMLGTHQAANAATASACAEELVRQGWELSEAALRQGLAAARCPARIELFGGEPTLLLDAAHNPASAQALAEVLFQQFPSRPKRLLFAISREKEIVEVLRPLAPHFREIVCTQFLTNPRAAAPSEIAAWAREIPGASWRVECCHDPHQALQRMLAEADPAEMLCVVGSFFLAAELRSSMKAAAGELRTPHNGSAVSRPVIPAKAGI